MGEFIMYIWQYFIIFAFTILFVLFIPDMFPKCSCCFKKKFRPFFKIHKSISINPGYGGSRSVCIKCCRKYGIEELKDLDRLILIKRKLKLDSLTKDL